MSDTARHDATSPTEGRHTLTVRDVETMLAEAGVQRSHRHVLRLCQSGMLDAVKIPGGPSGAEWYVAPQSVPKAIGDLKQIDTQRARRIATQPAMSGLGAPADPLSSGTAIAGRVAAEHVTSTPSNNSERGETSPDMSRHDAPQDDIFTHPYVLRLEDRITKLEAKYEAQVRRTEDIQIKSQEKLLELQRMTAVGQSQTLAEFMLKARNWALGSPAESDEHSGSEHTASEPKPVDNSATRTNMTS
jgi:hypothetical protein